MKNTSQKINKEGFTILELIAVMAVITVILGAVLAAVIGAMNQGKVTSTLSSIKAIQTAAVNFYNGNGGTYASTGTYGLPLSLANMATENMLPGNVASGTNAWGGTITVAPDANSSYFDITLTNVPASAGSGASAPLNLAVANIVQSAPTYTAKSQQQWVGVF